MSQGLFNRPSRAVKSVFQCGLVDASLSRPLREGHSAASECEHSPTSAVVRLFTFRGPSNVGWLVIAVIVDALKAVSIAWPRSNVGQETLKRSTPLRAHANPAFSVIAVAMVLGIMATGVDANPRDVFAGHPAVAGVAVRHVWSRIVSKASARFGLRVDDVERTYRASDTTRACAVGPVLSVDASDSVDGQLIHGLTDQCFVVEFSSHGYIVSRGVFRVGVSGTQGNS